MFYSISIADHAITACETLFRARAHQPADASCPHFVAHAWLTQTPDDRQADCDRQMHRDRGDRCTHSLKSDGQNLARSANDSI